MGKKRASSTFILLVALILGSVYFIDSFSSNTPTGFSSHQLSSLILSTQYILSPVFGLSESTDSILGRYSLFAAHTQTPITGGYFLVDGTISIPARVHRYQNGPTTVYYLLAQEPLNIIPPSSSSSYGIHLSSGTHILQAFATTSTNQQLSSIRDNIYVDTLLPTITVTSYDAQTWSATISDNLYISGVLTTSRDPISYQFTSLPSTSQFIGDRTWTIRFPKTLDTYTLLAYDAGANLNIVSEQRSGLLSSLGSTGEASSLRRSSLPASITGKAVDAQDPPGTKPPTDPASINTLSPPPRGSCNQFFFWVIVCDEETAKKVREKIYDYLKPVNDMLRNAGITDVVYLPHVVVAPKDHHICTGTPVADLQEYGDAISKHHVAFRSGDIPIFVVNNRANPSPTVAAFFQPFTGFVPYSVKYPSLYMKQDLFKDFRDPTNIFASILRQSGLPDDKLRELMNLILAHETKHFIHNSVSIIQNIHDSSDHLQTITSNQGHLNLPNPIVPTTDPKKPITMGSTLTETEKGNIRSYVITIKDACTRGQRASQTDPQQGFRPSVGPPRPGAAKTPTRNIIITNTNPITPAPIDPGAISCGPKVYNACTGGCPNPGRQYCDSTNCECKPKTKVSCGQPFNSARDYCNPDSRCPNSDEICNYNTCLCIRKTITPGGGRPTII